MQKWSNNCREELLYLHQPIGSLPATVLFRFTAAKNNSFLMHPSRDPDSERSSVTLLDFCDVGRLQVKTMIQFYNGLLQMRSDDMV